jgi:hypothetical protein
VKTPLLSKFERQLELVNDQICFSAFSQWEFETTLSGIVNSNPDDFTPAVFPSNPYADSIYRRIRELPSFAQEAQQVALRMGVVASVEHCLAYMKEVQQLKRDFDASDADELSYDADEEQLRRKVAMWTNGATFQEGYFTTMGYFRLLRNHYAHANSEPHNSLHRYVQSNSATLDTFWQNGVTDVKGVQFAKLIRSQPTPDMAFGMLNILRVSLRQIDSIVASTFPLQSALRQAASQRSKATMNGRVEIPAHGKPAIRSM